MSSSRASLVTSPPVDPAEVAHEASERRMAVGGGGRVAYGHPHRLQQAPLAFRQRVRVTDVARGISLVTECRMPAGG